MLYLLHGHGGGAVRLGESRAHPADGGCADRSRRHPAGDHRDAGRRLDLVRRPQGEDGNRRIHDLVGDAQHSFRAIGARNGRWSPGLSMGGYGALRFVLKYPEMFAAAGLLSPAIYDTEPPQSSGARSAGVFGAPDFDRPGMEGAELSGALGCVPRQENRRADVHQLGRRRLDFSSRRRRPGCTPCFARMASPPSCGSSTAPTIGRSGEAPLATPCSTSSGSRRGRPRRLRPFKRC